MFSKFQFNTLRVKKTFCIISIFKEGIPTYMSNNEYKIWKSYEKYYWCN